MKKKSGQEKCYLLREVFAVVQLFGCNKTFANTDVNNILHAVCACYAGKVQNESITCAKCIIGMSDQLKSEADRLKMKYGIKDSQPCRVLPLDAIKVVKKGME